MLIFYTATVKQVAVEAPFITEAKLRWLIFHAETNGLKPAPIKIGGRVYIDRTECNKWPEGQRMAPRALNDAARHRIRLRLEPQTMGLIPYFSKAIL